MTIRHTHGGVQLEWWIYPFVTVGGVFTSLVWQSDARLTECRFAVSQWLDLMFVMCMLYCMVTAPCLARIDCPFWPCFLSLQYFHSWPLTSALMFCECVLMIMNGLLCAHDVSSVCLPTSTYPTSRRNVEKCSYTKCKFSSYPHSQFSLWDATNWQWSHAVIFDISSTQRWSINIGRKGGGGGSFVKGSGSMFVCLTVHIGGLLLRWLAGKFDMKGMWTSPCWENLIYIWHDWWDIVSM